MVSDIGKKTAEQVTQAALQRYALDIIQMPEGENQYFEICQLGRMIRNAPQLSEGLTPYALEMVKQGLGDEVLGSILNHAPINIDPNAIALFAYQATQIDPIESLNQLAGCALALGECVKKRHDLAGELTLYGLNMALNGQHYLMYKILHHAPKTIDVETFKKFINDIQSLEADDPRKSNADYIISEVFKSRPDLNGQDGQAIGVHNN